MEVLDKVIELIKEMIPLLLAMGIPVGSVWGLLIRRKRQGAEQSVEVPQGTPVPATSSQAFQDKTLDYLIAHTEALEEDLEKAHDALRAHGINIP
jgi:hypothetical protein